MSRNTSEYTVKFAPYLREYIKSQSEEAITAFYNEIHPLLYRVAYSFVENRADAEDVLQTAFLKIMTSLDQCKGLDEDDNESIKAWCLSIVRNESRMKIRSQKSRKQREIKVSERLCVQEDNENEKWKDKNKDELYKNLNAALMELPEKYRIPIHLKFMEGMEYKEMAVVLTTNVDTLRVQIKRGLEKLSITLRKVGIVSSATMLVETLATPSIRSTSNADRILEHCLKSRHSFILKNTRRKPFYKPLLVWSILAISLFTGYYFGEGVWLKKKGNELHESLNQSSAKQGNLKLHHVWDFKNGDQNGTSLIHGSWFYSKQKEGMQIGANETVVLRLPINPGKKNFVIDIDFSIDFNTTHAFSLLPLLSQNEIVLGHKRISPAYKKILISEGYKAKLYFYDKYVFTETGGGFLYISILDQRPEDYELSIVLKSYLVKRIEINEMEEIAPIILQTIDTLDEANMPYYSSFPMNQFSADKIIK